jgi:caffeoyl-CoA O-methyltransferase
MAEDQEIIEYAQAHTTIEDDVLHQLYRETNLTTVYPRMLSGHLQGKFLEFISFMIQPSRILEIGTFTGYSAICLARGLKPGGMLHTIDINDEIKDVALRYFKKAGLEHCIQLHIGDACSVIARLDECFDLVFIDGDKEQYELYYHEAFAKLRVGGVMLVDNVLWGGKVLPGCRDHDKESNSIRRFNNKVFEDNRTAKILMPLRDGIYMLRKLGN